jgi:hypothetical protein
VNSEPKVLIETIDGSLALWDDGRETELVLDGRPLMLLGRSDAEKLIAGLKLILER